MSTVKKFNTDYMLDGPSVTITGNLNVLGNTTTIVSNNTSINDNIIMLNYGETGAGVTKGQSGIIVNRGSLANVTLQWNEPTRTWQITNDGTTYGNIFTNPLTSNLVTTGYAITSATNVAFGSNIQLNNTVTLPTAVTSATVIYAGTPSGGTTGIYVVNSLATNQELVTKTRAFGFSLIL